MAASTATPSGWPIGCVPWVPPNIAVGSKSPCIMQLSRIPFGGIKPRLVFVNSMSDLFHESVESAFIETLFEVMNSCPQHTFQVLTKRPGRVKELDCRLDWTPNIWLGVSIESERWLSRMHLLCRTGAAIKFLSLEPLLGPLPPRGADIRQMDRPRLVLPSV